MTDIHLGDCPFDASEQRLGEGFTAHGEPNITDRITGRPLGLAFVEMSDRAAARAAIE